MAQRLGDADPGAELLSETEPDPSALRAVPDPLEMAPEVQEALQQMMRQHEQRLVDESGPLPGAAMDRGRIRALLGLPTVLR